MSPVHTSYALPTTALGKLPIVQTTSALPVLYIMTDCEISLQYYHHGCSCRFVNGNHAHRDSVRFHESEGSLTCRVAVGGARKAPLGLYTRSRVSPVPGCP